MKTIILEQEQKDKLLEMCRVLFPEYTQVELTSSFPYYNSEASIGITWKDNPAIDSINLWNEDKQEVGAITIHWFEFCMIHIPIRMNNINSKIGAGELSDSINYVTRYYLLNPEKETIHPVDYIYETFKAKI